MSLKKQNEIMRQPELDDTQLMMVGDIHKMGDALSILVDQLESWHGHDSAMLAHAQHSLQTGISELLRSITNPEHF